jgi:hypothetical protein
MRITPNVKNVRYTTLEDPITVSLSKQTFLAASIESSFVHFKPREHYTYEETEEARKAFTPNENQLSIKDDQ